MLTLLVSFALAAAPEDLPKLKQGRSSGFESARAADGTLTARFCFTAPTKVCVPAGSWVAFTWSVCGPRSNAGCDDSHVTPSLRMVDASAPLEVYGYRWAAVAHRAGGEAERAGHTLVLDTEVEGQLAAPATIAGIAVLPGPTRLTHWERAGVVTETLLAGVRAEAFTCADWKAPPRTRFEGSCEQQRVSLTPPKGALLERDAGPEGEPTRARGLRWYGESVTWDTVEPVTLLGVPLGGEVALIRTADGGVHKLRGELTKDAELGRCRVPRGAVVVFEGDGGLAVQPEKCVTR